MINAWSLLYDEINGTMDKTYPVKREDMSMSPEGEIKIETSSNRLGYHDPTHYVDSNGDLKLAKSKDDFKIETSSNEGVVNVPSDINLDAYEHSNAWYDYNRNDPDRKNPFTDAFDHLMGESATGKTPWIYESPDNGKTVYRYERGTDPLKRELVDTLNIKTSGIEDRTTIRKYKEDESIKALQDYISTTYGGHYTSENNNVQTLDLIESVGDAESFCRSNAIKYLSRYDKKGQAKRDILKALHYSLLLYHFSGQLNETPTRGYETF